jgi:hypothetical protein
MAFSAVRGIIGPFLTFKQYIAMRLVIPTICYVFVSLSIAMVSSFCSRSYDTLSSSPLVLTIHLILRW